ncbi:hypothetical protein P8H27_04430 [Pseudomonas sp. sp1636]|uniref:hypothetical protein n=1 Tax=Pseudomonas sp. sp1636 TaxID=3036707 RepID=UPI0025A5EDF3|nr:hypothetical protein [Pseudomonas sp. sp1636]MDM8348139.1 hypothetical protein [Pseudomonas sp. sp1636]
MLAQASAAQLRVIDQCQTALRRQGFDQLLEVPAGRLKVLLAHWLGEFVPLRCGELLAHAPWQN